MEAKKEDITSNKDQKVTVSQQQEIRYHKSDIISYKSKYPDFSDALKGRTITLKCVLNET
jgi:hypothetical protein